MSSDSVTRGVIANEHFLSDEVTSWGRGSPGAGAEGGKEGGAAMAEIDQREESPASTKSDQDHYEPPSVSGRSGSEGAGGGQCKPLVILGDESCSLCVSHACPSTPLIS